MEPIEVLRQKVASSSQADVARELGTSRQNINNILAGKYAVSDELAERLGLEKIVVYRKRPS